ncbi:MAG: TonB-dependent receptor plug domain-containing protein, partial [Bacteroidota bacterium]
MERKNKFFSIIILLLLLTELAAQQTKEYKIDEVVVTASRIPMNYSKLLRTVSVINSFDIKKLPVNNIQDLLQHVGAVDLRARGVEGVQADAGIRGGTFEQTLILIDGVKIIDPQTGHNNLNLPISLDNVERIEVLKGEGSRMFGANAFSGAVNIITKKSKAPLLSFSALGGQNALFETNLFGTYPIGFTGNNFYFSKKKSDGYRYNTGFEITNFSAGQNIFLEEGIINFLFGYTDKKFGAYNFYS